MRRMSIRPQTPRLNEWGLTGNWTVGRETGSALTTRTEASTSGSMRATCIWCSVPGSDGKPVRFQVTIDGKPPGASHGVDTDADGNGTVTGERLYQLVREDGPVSDRTFEIRFKDPGVQAYAFTFG